MRVAIVAEWYPSPADPVHGIWAHRQAVAARDAGAEVRVLPLRRPIPPLATLRGGPPSFREWAATVRPELRAFELDGITIEPSSFVSPPLPLSYGSWGYWMAPVASRALNRLRRQWPFDLVHAHCIVPTGHAAARWTRRNRVPLVVSGHGPDLTHNPDRSRVALNASRSTLATAAISLANSAWSLRRFEEIAGGPVRGRVVHLGTDIPAELPPRRERPTVVTLAHLVERKRHAVVVRALAALKDRLPLDYLVIGEGPERRPLERLAAELGIGDRVEFRGQLENRAALAEARRCHLFAMPGIHEPFGVAFVEAMAGGLPAIGAQGEGGPEDIAAAGEGMVLVPPDDATALAEAIERIFAGGAEQLGAAARATVERAFTWERCGAATVAAYEDAVTTGNGGGQR